MLTGWLKTEHMLFAHWFDVGHAICGSGLQVRSAPLADETTKRCEVCIERTVDGPPPHKHAFVVVMRFGEAGMRRICRCNAEEPSEIPPVEISRFEDLVRGERRYLMPDGTRRTERIRDDERERMHHPLGGLGST
jgi:hypothetical protein